MADDEICHELCRPPLLQWGYWRLCLDEAQLVSRTNTQAASAVSDIYRRHAWVVTGTPITSKLEEIQAAFLFSMNADPDPLVLIANAVDALLLCESSARPNPSHICLKASSQKTRVWVTAVSKLPALW